MNKLLKTVFITILPFITLPYFMASCKKEIPTIVDPCAGINCQNGGKCLNGLCSCPTGFEGPACEKEKVPKSVTYKGIILKGYPPLTTTGAPWDSNSGPDLVMTISQNNKILYTSKEVSDFNHSNLPAGIDFPIIAKITDMTSLIVVQLYDADTFSYQPMDSFIINPYPVGKKFPEYLAYGCKEKTCLNFEIIFGYEF